MADDGDAATAASSPASDANNDNSNNHEQEQEQESTVKSAKDRACPFCGQAFTSSSLGRHLDLYIKPKNPKPADGVHDVDEIRKIRGGITRRQPRNSTKGAASRRAESVETPESTNKPSRLLKENSSLVATNQSMHAVSPILAREGIYVNTPSWQSTGVINNIPPRAPSRPDADASATGQAQRVQEMRRDTSSGQPMQRPDPRMPDTQKLQEQAEIGRAAELALREVLGSLQAARRKVEPGPIYEDFDFFAQSFPGLCLNILPPPTTLFSPAPFASPESWSLKPPGQQQSEVMNRLFNERCRDLRKADPDHPTDANIFRHSAHLQGAFENWRLMSDKDQQAAWTLEALRCFTTSRDTNSKLKRRLADAEQHTTHLEAQYDRLSRCQLPRESLLRPPQTIPISSSVAREAQKQRGSGQNNEYDADAAISRWRETVRSVTRPSRQSTAHLPNYAASAMNTRQTGRTITGDMIIHGSLDQGGPHPRANADLHRSETELNPGTVNYETPPHPGAILDDEDDHQAQTRSPQNYNYPYAPAAGDDEDLDEDVSNVLDTSLTNFVDRNALAKQRRFVQGSFSSSNSPGSGGGGAGTFGKFRVNGGARSVDTGSPVLNSNGKRPAAPAADMGFGGVGKGQRT